MSYLIKAAKLLATGIVWLVLTMAVVLVQLNIGKLLTGEFVVSYDGTVEVTIQATIVAVICVALLYFLRKMANLTAVQLSFYHRKFFLATVVLFVISSALSLFFFKPVYQHASMSVPLQLDVFFVFFVYLPVVVYSYNKYWRCPNCHSRLPLGISFFFSLSRAKTYAQMRENEKRAKQFKAENKKCRACKVVLNPG